MIKNGNLAERERKGKDDEFQIVNDLLRELKKKEPQPESVIEYFGLSTIP